MIKTANTLRYLLTILLTTNGSSLYLLLDQYIIKITLINILGDLVTKWSQVLNQTFFSGTKILWYCAAPGLKYAWLMAWSGRHCIFFTCSEVIRHAIKVVEITHQAVNYYHNLHHGVYVPTEVKKKG